jgi:branched-chain amino acid transport system permease protein
MTVFLQSLVLGLLLGGVYALAASGLTLIFGVMKVINIAHGAFLVLASFITYTLWDVVGIDPLLAIVITTPVVFAVGWVTYKVVVSPIRSAPMASTVLLTFGLALVLEGAMGEIWGNNSTAIRPSYADESFTLGGVFLPKAQLYGGLIAVAVLVVLWVVLTRTWLGRAIRAAASNPSSAQLVGIRTAAVAALVFAIGIAAAGAGGAITGVLYPFVPGSHYQWIARLLAIVVLGGLGSLKGSLIGALIIGYVEAITVFAVPAGAYLKGAVALLIMVIVLLARPEGLFGVAFEEER